MRELPNQPNLRVAALVDWVEKPLILMAAAVAAVVLVLWFLADASTIEFGGGSNMTTATAVGILLAAASLALSATRAPAMALRMSRCAAVGVLALSVGVVFTEILFVDQSAWLWPYLPAPETYLGFLFTGVSLLLIREGKGGLSSLADISAAGLLALVMFLLGGHLFHDKELVGVDAMRLTSPQTVFCFTCLAAVVLGRRAFVGGFLSILGSQGVGGRSARELAPLVLVGPFVLFGSIAYLDSAGMVPLTHMRALATPVVALSVLATLAWMSRRLNEYERQLHVQSVTDPLTNVLNSRGFDAVAPYLVHTADREGTNLVVLFFDLDGLKAINDAFGHDTGSLMIKRFAERLVECFRRNDVIARVGGDEFVVLAAATPETVEVMVERLDRQIADWNASQTDLPCELAYSVGCAPLPLEATDQLYHFVATADRKMYEDKRRKKAGRADSTPIRPARERRKSSRSPHVARPSATRVGGHSR